MRGGEGARVRSAAGQLVGLEQLKSGQSCHGAHGKRKAGRKATCAAVGRRLGVLTRLWALLRPPCCHRPPKRQTPQKHIHPPQRHVHPSPTS